MLFNSFCTIRYIVLVNIFACDFHLIFSLIANSIPSQTYT